MASRALPATHASVVAGCAHPAVRSRPQPAGGEAGENGSASGNAPPGPALFPCARGPDRPIFARMTAAERIEEAERARARGEESAALAAYEEAARLAHAVFDPALEARAMLGVGQLRALSEDLRGAREALQEAVARAMEGGDALVEADAHLAIAACAFDAGQSKDGHDALLEAMALYRQQDSAPAKVGLARATRLYGEHLGVLGSESDARQALQLARLMFEDLGDEAAVRGVDEDLRLLKEYSR